MKLLILFTFYLFAVSAESIEECDDIGDVCIDHEQCCGGCCFYGECVDTYRSCYLTQDVCDGHVCIGDEDCVVYVPPECPGCEPLPICRLLQLE